MRLIGLSGRKGAGKDSVATVLKRQFGFAAFAFAEPIKQGLMQMFGITRATFEDAAAKEAVIDWIGHSPRYLMQTLGTEWARQMVGEDIWIRHAQRLLVYYRQFATGVVITDVRFENEARWIRSMGGEVWHILRPLPENVTYLHASERGITVDHATDRIISNSQGLDQLADQVQQAMGGELGVLPGAA